MRVVFMGTPAFSVPALDAVAVAHDVVCVYTQPPRPAGRGQKLRPSPVHQRAEVLGIPVRHPVTLRDGAAHDAFAALDADVAVVVAYGLILPRAILDAPGFGCLNIHASLLPRWRGAAPIHRAVMAGDSETGVCIMQMEEGLDTGPVLLRRASAIGPDDTTGQVHDRLSELGGRLIVEALRRLPELEPVAQPESGVSYAAKVDKAEARIDWNEDAAQVDRLIRGLSPAPGAWFVLDGARVKVLGSRLADGSGRPGEVLDTGLRIACGRGAVRLTRLQRAGRAAQDAAEFQRGMAVAPGRILDQGA